MQAEIAAIRSSPAPPPVVVIDAPLLTESPLLAACDEIVFVDAPEAVAAREDARAGLGRRPPSRAGARPGEPRSEAARGDHGSSTTPARRKTSSAPAGRSSKNGRGPDERANRPRAGCRGSAQPDRPPDPLSARYESMKAETPRLAQLRRLASRRAPASWRASASSSRPPGAGPREISFELMKSLVCEDGCVFGEGVLEVLPGGFGFLRRREAGYIASPGDIYVSPEPDPAVRHAAGAPRPGADPAAEGPRSAMRRSCASRPSIRTCPRPFAGACPSTTSSPIHPTKRLTLEAGPTPISMRILDLWCPIGKGQRGLIVAAPRTGKTILLKEIADLDPQEPSRGHA